MSHMAYQSCFWGGIPALLLAMLGYGAYRVPAQALYQPSESLLAKLATLPSLEALLHPSPAHSSAWGTWAGPETGTDISAACFGHVSKTITIDPHSPYLPGSFPRPGGQPGTPTGASTPLPWDAMPVPSPARPRWHAHCSPDSVSPPGYRGWGSSRPNTPACSFFPRCMGVTLRTWAPLPRMRQLGCDCRRGTRPGPAAPPSCWSTPRAAVPPAVVRVTGGHSSTMAQPGQAAHPGTVVWVEFLWLSWDTGAEDNATCPLGHNGPK